jgi:hypothetical protein
MAGMTRPFQFRLRTLFWATALVAWFFALPAELRTFLLTFFAIFFSLVLGFKWAIKGGQSTPSCNGGLRLAILGTALILLFLFRMILSRS